MIGIATQVLENFKTAEEIQVGKGNQQKGEGGRINSRKVRTKSEKVISGSG